MNSLSSPRLSRLPRVSSNRSSAARTAAVLNSLFQMVTKMEPQGWRRSMESPSVSSNSSGFAEAAAKSAASRV